MRIKRIVLVVCFLVAFAAQAQNDTVVFSASGGFYDEVFALELYNIHPQNHICYTINGNWPTSQSLNYEEPLLLNSRKYSKSDIYTVMDCLEQDFFLPDSVQHCIVIRAAVFDENGNCVSQVMTNSYFIRALGCDTHGLPAVSLCADSLDLFGFNRGIFVPGGYLSSHYPLWTGNYFCKGREWERLCNVEFYEQDNSGINQQAGLRTHGGASRRFQQKGMKLYAREEYGKKRFKHRFFPDTPIDDVKHLNLKPFRCSNWLQTGLNDALSHRVARQLDVEVLGTRAVVVFLNGEYWGIYYLEEATDERYLEDHFGFNPDSCNIIKNWNNLDSGDDIGWQELYDWVESADLSLAEDYDYLCSKIDMHNFIDYLVFELYSSNVDWPANNVRCWQSGDRKWRWMFFDGDGCFFRDWDVFANIIDTSNNLGPSNATSTLFFRRLLKNRDFKEQFHSRFEDLMLHKLNYSHTAPVLASLREEIEEEIYNQSVRFGFPTNASVWSDHVEEIDAFLRNRNSRMEEQIVAFLSVGSNDEPIHFSCYPNPSSGDIHLSFDSDAFGTTEISIYDMMGRKVFAASCQLAEGQNEVTISPKLAAGVYLLRIGGHAQRIVRF